MYLLNRKIENYFKIRDFHPLLKIQLFSQAFQTV